MAEWRSVPDFQAKAQAALAHAEAQMVRTRAMLLGTTSEAAAGTPIKGGTKPSPRPLAEARGQQWGRKTATSSSAPESCKRSGHLDRGIDQVRAVSYTTT
jgi:hypothetical protein